MFELHYAGDVYVSIGCSPWQVVTGVQESFDGFLGTLHLVLVSLLLIAEEEETILAPISQSEEVFPPSILAECWNIVEYWSYPQRCLVFIVISDFNEKML